MHPKIVFQCPHQNKNETTNETINDTLNKNENLIINKMRNNPYITINEISNELNLSRSTIIRTTNKLSDKGIIIRIGSNKNGHWVVKE